MGTISCAWSHVKRYKQNYLILLNFAEIKRDFFKNSVGEYPVCIESSEIFVVFLYHVTMADYKILRNLVYAIWSLVFKSNTLQDR